MLEEIKYLGEYDYVILSFILVINLLSLFREKEKQRQGDNQTFQAKEKTEQILTEQLTSVVQKMFEFWGTQTQLNGTYQLEMLKKQSEVVEQLSQSNDNFQALSIKLTKAFDDLSKSALTLIEKVNGNSDRNKDEVITAINKLENRLLEALQESDRKFLELINKIEKIE